YAHGADGGGWSQAMSVPLTISNAAAAGGIVNVGTYGNPPAVTTGNEPENAPNTTSPGMSFVYELDNLGATNVTNFNIVLPGQDVSMINGYDGTRNWTLTPTGAPVISVVAAPGNASTYGCTVGIGANAPTSPTNAGANGFIYITGCAIPSGKAVDVTFSMLSPSTVPDTYKYTSAVNLTTPPTSASPGGAGGTATSEKWFSDQSMLIQATASLTVFLPNTGAGANYSGLAPVTNGTPAYVCAVCVLSQNPNTIAFGNVGIGVNQTAVDGVLTRLTGGNAAPHGFKLYMSANNNPVKSTGGNELNAAFDLTNSTQGLSLNATSGNGVYFSVPTTTPGQGAVDNGGVGGSATRYDMYYNIRISTGTEQSGPQTSTITFTWIAN
ncbi:MAG: hypothetical protein JOY59_03305, partial [Candidatus Eremiobacteraeota bacterium]|nr:hypothetical protein [Candidatus Eremiobacteraeota bacterium]